MEEEIDNVFFEILKRIGKLEKGQRKTIECPKCKKRMFVSKSSYNGHLFVNCETANCIMIIQ